MSNLTKSTISQRIKFLLTESKLSKSAFSDRIEVTRATLDNYLNDTTYPHQKTIENICSVFGVNEGWLLNGDGDIFSLGSIQLNNKSSEPILPWKDEAYKRVVEQNQKLNQQVERLTILLSKAMGVDLGKLNPSDEPATLELSYVASDAEAA